MIGPMRLEGKVALITGAEGPVGSTTALRFAREGALVVLNDSVSGGLDRLATEIAEIESSRALIALGDVTRPAHLERILREAREAFGGLDILINNAGEDPDTALRCATLCAESVLPAMRARRAGRVISVSCPATSDAAHAAFIALTRKLAMETAPLGVTVNCVVPGAPPREIAAALVFFASDEAASITGQALYVDGGLSLAA